MIHALRVSYLKNGFLFRGVWYPTEQLLNSNISKNSNQDSKLYRVWIRDLYGVASWKKLKAKNLVLLYLYSDEFSGMNLECAGCGAIGQVLVSRGAYQLFIYSLFLYYLVFKLGRLKGQSHQILDYILGSGK
jgi:hypothetical protein